MRGGRGEENGKQTGPFKLEIYASIMNIPSPFPPYPQGLWITLSGCGSWSPNHSHSKCSRHPCSRQHPYSSCSSCHPCQCCKDANMFQCRFSLRNSGRHTRSQRCQISRLEKCNLCSRSCGHQRVAHSHGLVGDDLAAVVGTHLLRLVAVNAIGAAPALIRGAIAPATKTSNVRKVHTMQCRRVASPLSTAPLTCTRL